MSNIDGNKFLRDGRYLFKLYSSMEFPLFFVMPKHFSDYMKINSGLRNQHLLAFFMTFCCKGFRHTHRKQFCRYNCFEKEGNKSLNQLKKKSSLKNLSLNVFSKGGYNSSQHLNNNNQLNF